MVDQEPEAAAGAVAEPPMRISVIGCGYLGATQAAAMAELGHVVRGIEIDPHRVAALMNGRAPFHEPGLDELLSRHVSSGRLTFGSDVADVANWADVHFVCVNTPQLEGEHGADLRQLQTAVEMLARLLRTPSVVVGRSTVPVGTAEGLSRTIRDQAPAGDQVSLIWSPEFLREGHAVSDTLRPDRIVIGVADGEEAAAKTLSRAYGPICDTAPVIVTDYATAELVKVAANSFLATKISFINAVADVCEVVGADVSVLADALGHDARIGRGFLNAGLGYGGGCLSKDVRAFTARASELGLAESFAFLREVDALNEQRRAKTVTKAVGLLDRPVSGARVAVLGAAFKPGSDDIRDSPALNVAGRLQLMGAEIRVYDPEAIPNARSLWPTLTYAETAEAACDHADLVLVLTDWPQFTQLDPTSLLDMVAAPKILDARNCLDGGAWRSAGWEYRGVGRR